MTTTNFPTGKYQIILADPPWKYHLRVNDSTHRNRIPYPSMTNEEILQLPENVIAAHDSYLFLWATKDHLRLAFDCVVNWGFTYKNTFTWLKVAQNGRPHISTGHWGRNCTEFLLIGARGKAKCFTSLGITNQPTIITAPRGKHSQKPMESFDFIHRVADAVDANTPQDRIELFARVAQPNWSAWGNELPNQQVFTEIED